MVKKRIQQFQEGLAKLSYVSPALRLAWKAAGGWTLAWISLLFVQGLLPAAIVYLTKWLVDSVAAAVGNGVAWSNVASVLFPAALMAGLMLLQRILGSLTSWIRTAQAELVQDHIKGLIHEKAARVDYGFYESADYYDQLEQANSQASGRTLSLMQNLGGVLQGTVSLLSIAAILFSYSIWLPVALIVSTLPAFPILLHHNRKYHTWWKRMTENRRWAQYFDVMLTLQSAAAEVRINNLGPFFTSSYQKLRKRLRTERLTLMRKQAVANLGAAAITLLVTGLTMAWIVWRSLRGLATLGDLALFYQAFNQGQTMMSTLLRNAGEIYTNTLFLEHLFNFLEQESNVLDPDRPAVFPASPTQGWRFEEISFTYPGNERPALENFSLHVPAGKIVAIVGENGAGKSTLIKLLCRFYDPDKGRITIDGIDIRDLAQQDLRRHISVMFQFPVRYQTTAAENIKLGDLDADHGPDEVERAARAAGAHDLIMRLPDQYNTLLGRWFAHGSELSGGEWQRVALARAFLRKAPIVVLDEPTSFMDTWAEQEWLKRFKHLVAGRTALIITHRFTTALQADIIYVMDRGHLVESGTHEELLDLGGRYATSWNAQMQTRNNDEDHEAPGVDPSRPALDEARILGNS